VCQQKTIYTTTPLTLLHSITMKQLIFILLALQTCLLSSAQKSISVMVLGIAQDAGYPQIGCSKICCAQVKEGKQAGAFPVSWAVMDSAAHQWYLIEASPNIKDQLNYFQKATGNFFNYYPDGIFLTHAHMGHYTGLMQLGREAANTKDIPVYCLPKMAQFLRANGPWSQLVQLNNIKIQTLTVDSSISIQSNLNVTAFTVPHRDEYSETAAFIIGNSNKKYLFVPDTDKWSLWKTPLVSYLKQVNIAFLDATFLSSTELPNRNINEIPHPLVPETIGLLQQEPSLKTKIVLIHFNHTNPLIWNEEQRKKYSSKYVGIASVGAVY